MAQPLCCIYYSNKICLNRMPILHDRLLTSNFAIVVGSLTCMGDVVPNRIIQLTSYPKDGALY